ncbi:MAG: cell division protein FtsW [Synergistaceae bacterium]|nr:cell division protein FtsW [Synergistaceae bacterium]MBQ3653165.1 cell division protein FtsW [Synergistaceae bacterium]
MPGRQETNVSVIIEIVIPLILSGCGLVMISSLSLRNSMAGGDPYQAPLKQFQFIGIGLTMMAMCMNISCSAFRRNSGKLFAFSLLLLGLTLIPGIGVSLNGARRWLNLPGFRLQPVELALFAVPVFMADRLADPAHLKTRKDFHTFITPTLTVIGLVGVPLLLQPNLGSTIIVSAICIVMHIERRGWKYPLWGIGAGAVVVVILILIAPYRMSRLTAFWDPWSDPTGKGFQIIQGLVAFANGSVTGVGIGRGLQEERYLPYADSDYIFPAIGEEFGLVGTMSLVILYALWTWRVYYIYRDAKDPFLKSLALGLTASVIFPMFVNVAGVTKLMPLTGIPMPFISAGGSSMIFMWAKVGLLMRVKMESAAMRTAKPPKPAKPVKAVKKEVNK